MGDPSAPNECDPSVEAHDDSAPNAPVEDGPVEVAECQGSPLEVTYRDVRLTGSLSGGSVDAQGYYPEQNIGEIGEPRTCLDIYIRMPQNWQADASVVLRVYASSETAESLVHSVLLTNVDFRFDIANKIGTGLVRLRSAVPHSWRVRIATTAGAPSTAVGEFSLISWGKEACTPDVAGEDGGLHNISPGPFVSRHALMMAWNTVNQRWQHLFVDGSGNLQVSIGGAGSLTVAGTHTPSVGAQGSPTDAVNVQPFTQVWNGTNWVPLTSSQPVNSATPLNPVQATTFPQIWEPSGGNWLLQLANNRGDAYVDIGYPNPANATNQRASVTSNGTQAFTAKASAAECLKVRASIPTGSAAAWLLFVDKASTPINGDVAVWEIWVPLGATVNEDFLRTMHFVNGLSFAWSSTTASVTLVAAPGAVSVQFA